MIKIIFIAVCSFLYLSNVYCQEMPPIQLDRPDQTESPFTVPKKYLQAEIGFTCEKLNKNFSSILLPTSLIKYGVSEKFELRLIAEIEQQKLFDYRLSGLNPLTLGFKTKILPEKNIRPMISFIGHVSFPFVATKKYRASYYAPSFRFTFQNTLSPKLSIGYNLGAEWDGFSTSPLYIYTLTSGFSVSSKIAGFLEVYGFIAKNYSADTRMDAGVTYLLNNHMAFDFSAGKGISSTSPEYFISTGFSFRFK